MGKDMIFEIIKDNNDSSSIFTQFMDKDVIGAKILKNIASKNNKHGFYLSDSNKNMVGVLTQGQALLTMLTMLDFSVDLTERRGLIFKTFDYILESIHQNGKYVFDTSPYIENDADDSSDLCDGYISTLSILCNAFIKFREYVIILIIEDKSSDMEFNLDYYNDLEGLLKLVESDIAVMLKKIVDQCIKIANPFEYTIEGKPIFDIYGSSTCVNAGWSFDKVSDEAMPNTDISLYFTYMASSTYIALLDSLEEEINNSREGVTVENPDEKQSYNIRFFHYIEEIYKKFNKCCYDAGHYIDYNIRNNDIDLAIEFISNDFNRVKYRDIESSTTNDALFNSLFAINIMINAGVDFDYAFVDRSDVFYETIQSSIQNISRCFNKLKKNGKEFIVSDFVLNFNEKLPTEMISKAKYLRKHRIQALSLLPLLITTHTTVSKYLIKYPQKVMQEYIQMIMANRSINKRGEALWCWSSDEYNVNVNYLFIKALSDFYVYYEQYELPFTKDEAKYNNLIEGVKVDYDKKIITYKKEIDNFKNEIKVLSSQKEPVVKEIERIIDNYMYQTFEKYANNYMTKLYATNNFESPESDSSAYFFKRSLGSYFHEMIRDVINCDEMTNIENEYFVKDKPELKETNAYKRAEDKVLHQLYLLVGKSLNSKI